jgi:hypothetical protein
MGLRVSLLSVDEMDELEQEFLFFTVLDRCHDEAMHTL